MRPAFPAVLLTALLGAASASAQSVCATPGRLEETFRMGSVDGPDALSMVRALELDAAGNIYLSQNWVPAITVFDPGGRPLRTIGGGGQGPGEFGFSPGALGWKGDTLWALEPIGAGTHLFGPDGREVARVKFRTPFPAEASNFDAGVLLADGSVLGARFASSQLTGSMDAMYVERRWPILRFSRDGRILDTIATVAWTSPRYVRHEYDTGSGRPFVNHIRHPLQDYVAFNNPTDLPFAVTADGAAVIFVDEPPPVARRRFSPLRVVDRLRATRGTFTLLKIGIDGDTIFARSIAYERKPITPADDERVRAGFADWIAMMGERDDATRARNREAARAGITLPEFFPPVRKIVAGHDGTVWLLREFRPDGGDPWEIYDSSGRLTGSVLVSEGRFAPMPLWPRMHLLRATRDEAWGLTLNDLDVPILHRYRVVPGCR
jgi:hypothetical protein